MKQLLRVMLISFFPLFVISQTTEEKQIITKDYNIANLEELAKSLQLKAENERSIALELAKQNNWIVRYEEDGRLYELMKVSENGSPLYYMTYNADASESTRANTLNSGGLLGLNLDGQNMEAHVWDGGLARSTHQEYDGPGGTNRFSIGDGTSTLHYHSAHVTGTIMAYGGVSAAKGMAPHASAIGYEWTNDVSEATTAATNGMLLSNHSYGWNIAHPTFEPWRFGAYASDSREWDVVMNAAPYYLMVVAAGNEGNDNTSNTVPLDGNSLYDKLTGHSTTKNNLVVANAQDANINASGDLVSVLINSGSSEGPCDDYRIKPDITGNGTAVYSTFEGSDTEYASISGTSMASPNVCGSLVLLQQHYNNVNSSYMLAATLKGLALHTADDAGPSGPDAVWGWGLLNAKEAASTITTNGSESTISEINLNNGGSYSIDIESDGINDMIASISWNDPAGTANLGTANVTTPVLVNDLDIRVTQGGSTYYPYRLTSITTNGTGDNIVDPFEKVIVSGASGTYTITVTHKGSLSGGSQNFSLIVTGKSGIPTAPIANFSADDVTPVIGQTISFMDLSLNVPTSWQWSFSPSTVSYVGGTSSTDQNLQVTFPAIGTYSVTLTATNALGSDVETKSGYIEVVELSYCTPTYTTGTSDGDYISLVQLGDINNATGASSSPYYTYYSSQSTDLTQDDSYTITLSPGTYGSSNYIAVWIDYNRDGTFNSTTEKLGTILINAAAPATGTINFTVPTDAYVGTTRMRVREVWNNANFDACSQYSYGETEDYNINILGKEIRLDLKAYLEGPFNGTNMNASIISDLPLSQPFNITPWNYPGSESVGSIPNANVVDWVLVDVRDAASAATATSATSVGKQAAFILNDGSIVGLDGSSNLIFDVSIAQNLYVVVWQRNHLGIMSNSAVGGVGGIYTYDYTTGINQVFGGIDGHKEISIGIWGMIGGDGNHDGQVNVNDKSPLWEMEAGEEGYIYSDHNLDGETDNKDKDDIWVPNEGKSSQVPN